MTACSDKKIRIRWKDESASKMSVHEKNGVVWLAYPALEAFGEVIHGFSTRLGGVSEGFLKSMNLSYSRGDDPERVYENYRRISDAIGFLPEQIVCSDQTHTTNVRIASHDHCGEGVTKEKQWKDVDGLITDERQVVLCTSFADCVPLYFYDPVHHAIGLSHSGWKGTVGQIGAITLRKMSGTYGSRPEDIVAAIGPSICQDCYEVSEDVIEKIRGVYDRKLWERLFYAKENGKYQLNLWEACRQTLLCNGIRQENLSMPNICTACNPEFLFSHRASQGKRGNLNAFLMLNE